MRAHASRPGLHAVWVVQAHVDDLPGGAGLTRLVDATLLPEERTRFDRFRHDVDRRMFLVGRLLARRLVGDALGCGPRDWTWREGARGRPEIDDASVGLRFNLAHSAGLVVCALSDGRDVGVDVESLTRRSPDAAIVDRYCAPAEVADIRAQGAAWPTRFLTYWTLKEAYLKARGLGIAVPLRDIAFDLADPDRPRIVLHDTLRGEDDRWRFTLLRPTPSHVAAVATSAADDATPTVTVRALPLAP